MLLKTLRGINEFTAAQEAQVLEATETEPTRSPTQPASAGSNGVPLMAGISIMFVAATITTLAIRAVATKRTKTTEPTQNHRRDLAHVANLFGSSQDYGTIRKRIMASLISIDDDPRFVDNRSRLAHRDELVALVAAAMRARSTDEWLETLEAVGVPCGPINTLDRVFADPQVVHRGLRMDLPTAGDARHDASLTALAVASR